MRRHTTVTKTERLNIRISPELKEQLQALADAENRTLSNYVEQLIINAVNAKESESKT